MATLCVAGGSAGAVDPAGHRHQRWKLVFHDEFSGRALDRSKWHPSRWFADHCAPGATPGELEYYTARRANVSVSHGRLRLIARKKRYRCREGHWAGTHRYTSGWVQSGGSRAVNGSSTRPGFTIGLGYVEARVKLPRGKGLWSAVWMQRVYTDREGRRHYPSRPEIDNLEILGNEAAIWRFNAHLRGGIDVNHHYSGPNTTAGWHRIGVWRKARRIEWYADGRRVWIYRGRHIPGPRVRMYLILNLVVGGDYPGNPPARIRFPKKMLVDYVRAWKPMR